MKQLSWIIVGSLIVFIGWGPSEVQAKKEYPSSFNKISQLVKNGEGEIKVIIATNAKNKKQFPNECMEADIDSNYRCGPDKSWGCYQGNWAFSLKPTDTQYEDILKSIHTALVKNAAVKLDVSSNCELTNLQMDTK